MKWWWRMDGGFRNLLIGVEWVKVIAVVSLSFVAEFQEKVRWNLADNFANFRSNSFPTPKHRAKCRMKLTSPTLMTNDINKHQRTSTSAQSETENENFLLFWLLRIIEFLPPRVENCLISVETDDKVSCWRREFVFNYDGIVVWQALDIARRSSTNATRAFT
jgi:hypothetical protein